MTTRRAAKKPPAPARLTGLALDRVMQSTLSDHDVIRARERLGPSDDARLRWVIEFVERDLEKLSTAEWLTLGAETLAIVRDLVVPAHTGRLANAAFDVNSTSLREAQQRVAAVLSEFTARRRVNLPPAPEYLIWSPMSEDEPDVMRVRRVQHTRGLAAVLITVVMHLLEGCSRLGRLRRCPECGRPFVAVRRQLRHPACAWANRARTRQSKREGQRKPQQGREKGEPNG